MSKLLDDACAEAVEMKPVLIELVPEVMNKKYRTKLNELPAYQAVRATDAAYQGRLALAIATAMHRCSHEEHWRVRYNMGEVLGALLRGTLGLEEDDYLRLFKLYGLDFSHAHPCRNLWYFPVGLTLAQVGRLAKKQGQLSPPMLTFLNQLLQHTTGLSGDEGKIALKVQEILNQVTGVETLPTIVFADGDPFGQQLNEFVAHLDVASSATGAWLRLLQLWQKANGGQPTAKLRKELEAAIAAIGVEALRHHARGWLELLIKMPVEEKVHDMGSYTYTSLTFLMEANAIVAKGLVWAMQPLADNTIQPLLANLAVKCYRKIPGKGPLAAGLGNACLLTLAEGGLPGVALLARVRPKIKQTNTQELIARHIEKAARELGVSPAEVEDMAVPDCALHEGRAVVPFGEYTATLTLTQGKADVAWEKAGQPLKSAPAALKATHAADLKQLKETQAQAQQTYTAQRERLDRSFVEERRIPWPWFAQYYFHHGLLSGLVRPLIWRLQHPNGAYTDALWLDQAWRDAHGQPVPAPDEQTQLQLWHPVMASPDQVLAWRALLEQHQLRQPLKQAFREVYLLTPPEERTATYSNRMAAHILKQHQFNSLAKLRGWRYSLLGAYDKGYESDKASLALPAHNLQAEFWVSEVNADAAWNDTGIWNYISTDQVRFVRSDAPVPLPQVPPVVFSEVMRDVDLFVGVASVGNDPLWRDNGGLVQYRNYWENYSFGELGEVAKNRKLALERLVPRLKIGKVSAIQDRFLVVKGKLRTYKIHLGSGNILMEPNDEYLCIVPDRSAKAVTTDVFLPFEGDAVLSIILSKALLLMDDNQITDETINRQIKR
ncbi:DUF4132 domain-containing protein [Hymenobacter sp. BT664]|uniref:DUF4132 domain-containing protein n=1 Tax=Hymenobacter montanus TaxID=2771359 RepID=A0A927BFJ9_9BACT|nr:DUF4132 domain-containing protein [Hymenobacter montanus]MBD2769501.1 DUF4132 domain-containing protein [Hymenobacter montanus]